MTGIYRNNFIERSIAAAASFVKGSVFSDEYASKKGLLQSIDPRIKLLTSALFLLTALFTKNIAVTAYLYALSLLFAYLSKIPLNFFLKRTWIFIPIFSLFMAIPAIFSVFTPGEAAVSFSLSGAHFTITRQGLSGASLFVMRVVTSVSFAILLSITTRHFELLKVLRIFGVPQIFVMILGMCYRYIYLFAEVIENTYIAIKSRVGFEVRRKEARTLAAWNIASLWYRSYRLNEDVYSAMLSRGYEGEPVILNTFRAAPKDWLWLAAAVMMCAAPLYLMR